MGLLHAGHIGTDFIPDLGGNGFTIDDLGGHSCFLLKNTVATAVLTVGGRPFWKQTYYNSESEKGQV
jgi:hypothetical protein